MNVLLIRDVPGFGRAGEIKTARPGYVRNFLFPQQLAVEATPDRIAKVKRDEAAVSQRRAAVEADLQELMQKLGQVELRLSVSANAEGRLYGSVSVSQIRQEISNRLKLSVPESATLEPAVLKTLGEHRLAWHFPNHQTVHFILHLDPSP